MNIVKILRLGGSLRKRYIQESIEAVPIQTLRQYAREFGIHHSDRMQKHQLVDIVVKGLTEWAEASELEIQ